MNTKCIMLARDSLRASGKYLSMRFSFDFLNGSRMFRLFHTRKPVFDGRSCRVLVPSAIHGFSRMRLRGLLSESNNKENIRKSERSIHDKGSSFEFSTPHAQHAFRRFLLSTHHLHYASSARCRRQEYSTRHDARSYGIARFYPRRKNGDD